MAFRSGRVSNSHQLAQIIHAAMRDEGWTLQASLKDGYDSVFYSTGVDGYHDIYLRVAAGQSDLVATGDVQFPSSDGYTGFVNFFAYQFFPEGGSEEDGLCEIGRFGPIMYHMDNPDSSSDRKIEEYNMYSSTTTGRRRILRDSPNSNSGDIGESFDGHRFMWIKPESTNTLSYLDLAREQDSVFSSNRNSSFFQNVNGFGNNFVLSRKSSNELLAWAIKNGTNAGLATFDVRTEDTEDVATTASTYSLPPWGTTSSAGNGGWMIQGSRRTGNKYIYVARGNDTTTWAKYDIDENEWTSLSPGFPAGLDQGSHAVLVLKEASGYETDRLYVTKGNNQNPFYSIALDDAGDPTGSWTTHTVAPFNLTANADKLLYCGGDRIFLVEAEDNDLHYFTLPATPTDSGTWTTLSNWFVETNENQVTLGSHYHLASRARVDEFDGTRYWVFVDLDRVIVVTETLESSATDDYHFAYAGLFESYADVRNASLVSTASSGTTTLEVDDPSLFKEGIQYRLVQVDDSNTSTTTAFNGLQRKIAHAEFVTVDSVKQHSVSPAQVELTSPLTYTYNSGAIVGEEVQPICLSVDDMSRAQSLNTLNTSGDINDDPPYQWYTFKRSQLSQRLESDRIDGTNTWPIILAHSGAADNITVTNRDARGQLKNVFFASTALNNEDIIEIGGERYICFSIFQTILLSRVAIGPLE